MAKDIKSAEKRPKRRLKAPAETVRQRQLTAQGKLAKPRSRRRRVLAAIGWPFRKIASWGFWQTKWWKPFRFIGRIIGHVIAPPYVRNSFKELRLVTWPNWRQTWRLTFAVLAFSAVFGVAIAFIDFVLDKLFKEVLLK
ncbi:preprotein translocase subunit SecE [Candidatus Saccharibacteria bacterium]|nr:preprotein translocase subunit SecE [Candidatus Saccharibacteria bacterium]